MTILYQDSFARDWTVEQLLSAFPGLTRVSGWQTGNAVKNALTEEFRLLFGSQILGGAYTSTEWAFNFTLKVEGNSLPTGTGPFVPVGESRIIQIGAHVGIRLIPGLGDTSGFKSYSLGLYVVNGSTLVETFPLTGLNLTVGEDYHIQAKITVGASGTFEVIVHNRHGLQVFSQTVTPVLAQGTLVQNGFASMFILPGMTIGHLVVSTELEGLLLTVPLTPDSAGSIAQWVSFPSGVNWEIAAKETFAQTPYVQSTTSGHEDSYNVASPPSFPAAAQVSAIMVGLVARAEYETTPPEITALWSLPSQSATRWEITSGGKEVSPSLTPQVHVIDENPNTTDPFVFSELTNTQIGVKLL